MQLYTHDCHTTIHIQLQYILTTISRRRRRRVASCRVVVNPAYCDTCYRYRTETNCVSVRAYVYMCLSHSCIGRMPDRGVESMMD